MKTGMRLLLQLLLSGQYIGVGVYFISLGKAYIDGATGWWLIMGVIWFILTLCLWADIIENTTVY